MNENEMCINCVWCDEYRETYYFCEYFCRAVSGRNFCPNFVSYPQIPMP